MMEPQKPVILLVCGAWHKPMCYNQLKERLEARGYEFLCPRLPTLGPNTHGTTYHVDVERIREVAIEQFEQGKEVVIIGHSYGGVPACAATKDLGVHERAQRGEKGGFMHILYIAGFAVPQRGWDLLTTFGGAWPDWQNYGVAYAGNHVTTVNEKAKHMFYNDLPEAEAQMWFETLEGHSQDAWEVPVDYVATDITIPKTYMICEDDAAFPLALQEQLARSSGFQEVRIKTGHSPFLSQPDLCTEMIVKIAERSD